MLLDSTPTFLILSLALAQYIYYEINKLKIWITYLVRFKFLILCILSTSHTLRWQHYSTCIKYRELSLVIVYKIAIFFNNISFTSILCTGWSLILLTLNNSIMVQKDLLLRVFVIHTHWRIWHLNIGFIISSHSWRYHLYHWLSRWFLFFYFVWLSYLAWHSFIIK